MSKKTFFALFFLAFVLIPALVGILISSSSSPPVFTLKLINQGNHSIAGTITFLDKSIEIPNLEAQEQTTHPINLRELREKSAIPNKVGQLILHYQIDNSPEQTFEIFGYIEPGGTYLYGREGVLTFDAQGTPTIQISTD